MSLRAAERISSSARRKNARRPIPCPRSRSFLHRHRLGKILLFNQAENRIDNRAANQSQHAPGEEKSESANAAAEVKEGEKQSHAQKDQVGKMDAEAQNPPEFDKEAFVAKVLAQVEAIAPGTLDDVMKFESRGQGGEVKDAVTGQVQESTDSSAGPLDEAAAADPGVGESPRAPTALEVEPPGAQPGSVRADRAMPPPRTESEMDMRPETVQTENILKEACITRGFMEKHDDPELKEGIAAQDELGEASATKPQEFRDQEAGALADARAGASGEGAAGVQAMFGERAGEFGDVAQGQQQTKTDNEAKRAQAAEEINGVFTSTQEKVQSRLKQLDTDVMTTFDTEAAAATARWEASVRADAEKYQKSWFDTAVDWFTDLLFDPPPEEVRNFYNEATQTFHAEMRVVIENIAGIVETGLKDARKLVEEGKADVQKKLDALGTDLEDFKQQISEQMNDKFRGLEGSIVQKQGELVQGLAQRYVKANERLKELEKQIREEYKNFLEKAADAYHAVKDLIVGQIEKLAALVGGAAKRIIKDPGKFLSNLGEGIIQGLTMFIGSIGENIKGAVVEWLTGNLGGAGIALPKSFDAKGIIGFLLELVGLGIAAIKNVARKVLGSTVVALIEKGEAGAEKIKQIFDILASEGPAGLFRFLQAEFEQMKEQVLGEAGKALAESLVIAGIKKVLGIISGLVSGGVGTIITIVLTIIDVILWFRDNAARLAELVSTIAGTAMAILQGQVGVVASAINNVLKRLLPVVLGFVGALIGIGGAVRKIQQVFKAIKTPATKAITALFQKLKKTITKLLGKAKKTGKEDKKKKLTSKQVTSIVFKEMSRQTKATTPADALAEKKAQAQQLIGKYQPQLEKGRLRIVILDRAATDVEEDAAVDFDVSASPGQQGQAPVPIVVEDEGAVRQRFAHARSLKKFTGEKGFGLAEWAGTFSKLAKSTHQKDLRFGVNNAIIQQKAGAYLFGEDVPKEEIVERGAGELQNAGRSHAPFEKGRFGVPLIQGFLTGRKIAGIPPDSFSDRGIVSEVAARAESAGAIKKVGKTTSWALPLIPAKRTLPAGWGGVTHVRPRYYERGAGFPGLANDLADQVINSEIRGLIEKQLDNIDDANQTGTAIDMGPWQTMIAREFAKPNETFNENAALADAYYQRNRYHVDHVKPLAGHWNQTGYNSDQGVRVGATQGKPGGLALLEKSVNMSKGSGGINYQLWVGSGFTSSGGDQFHADSGEPFEEFA